MATLGPLATPRAVTTMMMKKSRSQQDASPKERAELFRLVLSPRRHKTVHQTTDPFRRGGGTLKPLLPK